MASLRSLAISLLRIGGHANIAAANRHHARDPQRTLQLLLNRPGVSGGLARQNPIVMDDGASWPPKRVCGWGPTILDSFTVPSTMLVQ